MNISTKTNSLFILLFFCMFYSCKESEKENIVPEPIEEFAGQVIDISIESELEYLVVAEDGSFFATGQQNGLLVAGFVPEKNHEVIPLVFDEQGFPDKIYFDDHLIQFDGFDETKLNISILNPDQTIEIYREVESGFNWSLNFPSGVPQSNSSFASRNMSDRTEILKWISYSLGGVTCALSAAGAISTGGAGVPLAYLTCGNFAASILINENEDAIGEAAELFGLTSQAVNGLSTILGCGIAITPVDFSGCVLGTANMVVDVLGSQERYLIENQDEVRIGDGVLKGNSGDVQVTLTWNTTDDIDLHLWDPNSEHISWENPISQSGGQLDIDNMDGYGPENIFFPSNMAPNGIYEVGVHHYAGNYETQYKVVVYAFDQVKVYSGVFTPGEYHHIANFDQNGIQMGNKMNFNKEFLLKVKR